MSFLEYGNTLAIINPLLLSLKLCTFHKIIWCILVVSGDSLQILFSFLCCSCFFFFSHDIRFWTSNYYILFFFLFFFWVQITLWGSAPQMNIMKIIIWQILINLLKSLESSVLSLVDLLFSLPASSAEAECSHTWRSSNPTSGQCLRTPQYLTCWLSSYIYTTKVEDFDPTCAILLWNMGYTIWWQYSRWGRTNDL